MQRFPVMKCICVALCILVIAAEISSAAPYSDYESLRDILELLLRKDDGQHQVVRKSNRSPSLRLRFGRRADPALLPASPYLMSQSLESDPADN